MKHRTGRIVSLHLVTALLALMSAAVGGGAQYASSPYANYPQQGVQSVWSGSPIVVNDNLYGSNNNLAQGQQQYPLLNEYYGGDAFRQPYPNWRREERTTRAPNHNYNNVPAYFYYQQQEHPTPSPTQPHPYLPANSEFDSFNSRPREVEEEEQVVQIGGTRSLATNHYQNVYSNSNSNDGNYYEPAEPWRRGDFEAKYAKHFSDYLRKFPQRLRPVYHTGEDFDEK